MSMRTSSGVHLAPQLVQQARNRLEALIASYAQAWANEQSKAKDKALEAARKLAQHLQGQLGHRSLLNDFLMADEAVSKESADTH